VIEHCDVVYSTGVGICVVAGAASAGISLNGSLPAAAANVVHEIIADRNRVFIVSGSSSDVEIVRFALVRRELWLAGGIYCIRKRLKTAAEEFAWMGEL
jgi:hypothetical protein